MDRGSETPSQVSGRGRPLSLVAAATGVLALFFTFEFPSLGLLLGLVTILLGVVVLWKDDDAGADRRVAWASVGLGCLALVGVFVVIALSS